MAYTRPQFYRLMSYAAAADRDVVDLVSGSPDWGPPDALRAGLKTYSESSAETFHYPPSAGLEALREEIATRRSVDPESVVITNGAGEANYLALAAALEQQSGSEVTLTDPVYPYYPGKTELLDATATFVATDDSGHLDPDAVERATSPETACILINTPNNPTGAVYSTDTMEALIDIAKARNALLISDEVYDHFDLSGRFTSALTVDSTNCIVTNSFSKSMAVTGLRVGYAIVPQSVRQSVKTTHLLINVAGSRPAQFAVLHALKQTSPDYYATHRETLQDRATQLTAALEEIGAEHSTLEGGFYIMARFEGFPGTMAKARQLIDEAGVAAMPGETFGDVRSEWFRFSLVDHRISEAANRLTEFFTD